MIYILAGGADTGKSKALHEWINTWDSVKGILSPKKEGEGRYLYDIETEDKFQLEVLEKTDKTISVDGSHFLADSYKMANYLLIKTFDDYNFEFLVLDELGKLELKNNGIHIGARYIIDNYESNDLKNILIVVQTHLVKDIIEHYGIRNFQIVAKETLP